MAADAREIEEPLAKGDLLPSPFLDVAVPKTVVGTVKITPTEPPQRSEAQKNEVASWHCHEGSKIVRSRATAPVPTADKRITRRR